MVQIIIGLSDKLEPGLSDGEEFSGLETLTNFGNSEFVSVGKSDCHGWTEKVAKDQKLSLALVYFGLSEFSPLRKSEPQWRARRRTAARRGDKTPTHASLCVYLCLAEF